MANETNLHVSSTLRRRRRRCCVTLPLRFELRSEIANARKQNQIDNYRYGVKQNRIE